MYATTGKAINIVTNGSGTGISTGHHVYFGTKSDGYSYSEDGGGTIPYWRVLDHNNDNAGNSNAMFVMAESLWGTGDPEGNVYFKQNQPYSNAWQGSDAKEWCGTFRDAVFSSNEESAIKNVSKHDNAETLYEYSWDESSLSNEKVFFLSVKEVYDYISQTEGDALKAKYKGTVGHWWLRSPSPDSGSDHCAGLVSLNGIVVIDNVYTGRAARPAFNIDLESVILTSAAEGGKDPGTVGDGTLNKVAEYTGDAWKLTISDSTRSSFTASAGTGATVSMPEGYTSWTVPVTYSGAQTGTNEHVSAILTNSAGTALYYGHIATNSTGGTGNVTIPTGLTEGTYTLNVFNEQCNGDKKTDLSSPIRTIGLTVTEAQQVATPTFTPAEGTYTEAQNVGIKCDTAGADIYYTADGSEPSKNSGTKYTSAISVSDTTTIKAIAVKDGMTDSSVASAKYTINRPVPPEYRVTVTVSPAKTGTAKASVTSGKTGTNVKLTAVSKAGYKFKNWKVVSGGIKLADATKAKTTFAIKDADVKVKAIFEKVYEAPQPEIEPVGDDGISIAWWKVKEAKGYDIFMSRCNHDGKEIVPKLVKTIKGNKTFKWIATGLKPNKPYKAYVRAYVKDKNGKKKYISRSPLMHVYTAGGSGSITNAKSIKLDTSDGKIKKGNKLSLKVKDTYKIKASVKKADKNKRLVTDSHVKRLRYRSSDPGVATVSASGKITAKKKGKCNIYVYAHNGINQTIKLTVK